MTGPIPLKTREDVQAALDETGTIAGAARRLQVSRPTVYEYISRYGITEWKRPRKRVA
jgi:transcriptional regulator with GAF, ATPase, and Fis domain